MKRIAFLVVAVATAAAVVGSTALASEQNAASLDTIIVTRLAT